ncbi:hypothetical protein F2P45_28655 [Massilia sp. CCM 8733]|uniref:Uncharacterized protein n=1 Tax=Massilia mucilaginosa TaxID=2609282 RepID=A0ABX0P0X9_9BURK|nr:hypothetical protein [Massilia mucilaginosa]NHZ92949.1 hypothetical protein [Massilia mucilaginosa]
MIVISGRKNVYRKLGYVADFCPICRSVQAFLVRRIGRASHLYFISLGKGDLAGFDRICQSCLTPFPTESKKYTQILKNPAPLAELRASTFPNLEEVWQERLALEARVSNAPLLLSAEERRELILSPFLLLVPKVERCYNSAVMDKQAGYTILGAVLATLAGWAVAGALFPGSGYKLALGIFVIGYSLSLWQILAAKTRRVTREVVPAIARGLRPLAPSEREVRDAFATVSAAGHKMGAKLELSQLLALLK